MDEQSLEPINNNSVPIQYIAWKTCRERWAIEIGGEKGSGRSMPAASHDGDDEEMRDRRMYDVNKEAYFSFKICTNRLNIDLPQQK